MNANKKSARSAVEGQHLMIIEDMWVDGIGDGQKVAVFTRWEDTEADAKAEEQQYKQAGCHFTAVYRQPRSALGLYRVVAHKVVK